MVVIRAACLFSVESRETCCAILGEFFLQQGAVTVGGKVGAIGVDSQILLLESGLELGAGLSRLGLEMGVRVSPHMGGVYISEDTGGILL